ncbi:MAG: hypothetical protein P8L85_07990 [Rubripirellula sp.]|nr:hypothetical protein [Rubripirellula sp.]
MSTKQSSNLNRLLRLLTKVASAAECQQSLARLREDEVLRSQHAKLVRVATQPLSLQQALLHTDGIDADLVAAYVDGQLDPEARDAFELRCWNSESLLREVIAVWRMEYDPRADQPLGDPESESEHSPLSGKLASSEEDGEEASIAGLSGDAGSRGGNPLDVALGQLDRPVQSVHVVRPPAELRRERKPGKSVRHSLLMLVSAAVLVAVLLGTWGWFFGDESTPVNPDQFVQDNSIPTDGGSIPQQIVQDDVNPQPPKDLQQLPKVESEMEGSDPAVPDETVVQVPRQPDVVPEPRVPDRPRPNFNRPPSQPRVNVAKWMNWSPVRGVAATRDASSQTWRGIEVPSRYSDGQSIPWIQVTTMAGSRLIGEAGNGTNWTADASTSFKISQREQDAERVVVCDLAVGRLAVENLTPGQQLLVKFDQQDYRIEIDERDTALVLHRLGPEMVVGVFRGGAVINDGELSRDSWWRIGLQNEIVNWRPGEYDAWYNTRENKRSDDEPPATLRNALNNAPNFLAQVADVGRNGTPVEKAFSARAILRCSAAENRAPSDPELRTMMAATQESVRASLIRWLEEQCLVHPRFGMAMAKKLGRLQKLTPAEQQKFEEWFAVIARGLVYNDRLLNQFKSSLTSQSKPVVRQAAKRFLEIYLKEKLDFYNPISPGPPSGRAIKAVQQRVSERQRLARP